MQVRAPDSGGGVVKFFRLTVGNDSLANYYKVNFALVQHHKYSLTEIENMMVWERDVYVMMLIKFLDDEREKIKELKKMKK